MIEGFSRSNSMEMDSSKYEANRTLIVRIFCESRARDDQVYHMNGEILTGELNFVLLPGIETLNLQPTSEGLSKESSQLGRGITSFYRSISSLSRNTTQENKINWRLTKLLHFLHPSILPTSFTVLLTLINPLRSHYSLTLQSLALAHRIRKIVQRPAPCRIMNKAVVVSYLRERLKEVQAENVETKKYVAELQEELQTTKGAFTAVSIALDQANEKSVKDSEELKKYQDQLASLQSAEELQALRITTLE